MAGGILIFGMLIFSTVFFQYYDLYQSKVTQEWADLPAEEQTSQYNSYMTTLAWISVLGLALRTINDLVFD